MTAGLAMGFVALASACVQWLAASHRDLGVTTVSLAGAVVVLAAPPGASEVAVLGIVAGVAALGWHRGSRHGVGRPGLTGAGLCVAVLAGGATLWGPALGLPADRIAAVGLGLCLISATLGLTLALERPGPRRRRPRWYRKVPIA